MVQEFPEGLCILLESAIMYGQNDELLNFLASENATSDDFDCIINKLGENLDDCFDFPVVLDNILLLIGEILSIANLSLEQTVILSRSLLLISSNVNCSISNTKQVLNMLNKSFDDQQVASWLINDKSLEIVVVALGKRLFVIGDFECQIAMFEVMCRLASCVHDKIYWARLWFSSKQLKAKFLNLRQDQFEQDSRKILNYINMMEPIPRVFSFMAKSVWLGEFQLQKPQDSDFWIDLSFGSQIISFFCSEIFSEEEDPPWETVSISAGMIDNYTICDNAEEEMTTLILQLKCSCNQLMSTNSENVQFGRDEVKITFWCPDHNIKKLVARLLEEDYEEEKIELSENLQIGKRKISVSTEITSCEQFEETEASVIKRRKLSENSDLLNVNELQETEAIQQGHRKISESENLMNAFETKNDPVLPSVGRKLSEIDELMETHQIEETNILPKKIRKLSQSKEIITSEENETNAISMEQVKTAIDEILKTNIVEKLNDTVAVEFDDLNLPCLDVFSNKEPPKEENLQKDTEAKKKKDSPSSKKENTAKKRTRRKQTQRQNFSSDVDSDSQIISDKNSKKKIEKKKIQRQKILDEDFDTRTLVNKKPRAAALNAKRKNKSLLKQKELDENSILSSTIKRKYESEDDVSCYSPKKKKNNACSIFQTDTETQSSEISWFKGGKRGLFQTPPLKNYTRKNYKSRTSLKKWKQQGAIQKKREFQKKTKFFDDKSSESGTKSKSMGLSDIDKFSLVVEKESPKKMAHVRKSTNFHFELLNSVNEKILDATSDENLNHNFTDNDIIGGHSNPRVLDKLSLPKQAKKNISKDNQSFKIKPVKQKEKFLHCNYLKISDEKSKLKTVRKFDTYVKDGLCTSLKAFDKTHDDLCSTIQNSKFGLINQNNYSKSEGDQMDINIEHPETLFDGSESRNEFTATLNIQEEKCDLSKPSSLPDIHETDENVCRTLSIESLNSLEELRNEESGKKLHMKLFLESLSSESPPPPSDMGDFCARVVSKRSSSQCSFSVNEIPCKNIKTDKNQNDQSDLQFSPKKMEKKVKRKLNVHIGSIVKNRKSEKIFIHSEKKSPSSPNKQFKDKKQNKADLRIHQNIIKNVSKMKQMSSKEKLNMEKNLSYSVLTKLASEVNLLTKRLFGTLQKCTSNFCNELNILRSNFLIKIEDMISHNTNLSEKDLKKLALNCKESRLQIQTSFEQITEIGRIYFEAEQMKEKKLKNVHRKITVKYCCHLRAAVEVAVKSIEERIVGRAGAMFKKFLQGI
ncbi:synaptonemal complex protein 2 isoform X6 [Parasteatoda tepidariorum]|uniref:synaptonemal complex protein 2 isoform X6 n=1 Tax=Parasteatoda tepidariorum TaxID=114398 RepID=UPI001C727C19|nr:synaptonemal complex protein 2 isoform X6 [Parasteatoda tepidariorum]